MGENKSVLENVKIIEVDSMHLDFFEDFIREDELLEVKEGKATALGAICDKVACGVMICSKSLKSYNLEWIYVVESYRNQGIAKALLETLLAKAHEDKQDVVTDSVVDEENVALMYLLKSKGFELQKDETTYVNFSLKDVLKSKYISHTDGGNVYELKDVSSGKLNVLFNEIIKTEGFDFHGADKEMFNSFSTELSCIYERDKSIQAILLITEESNEIEISYLYSHGGHLDKRIIYLVDFAVGKAIKKGIPESTNIKICCVEEKITKFLSRLIENCTIVETNVAIKKYF